MTDCFTSQLLSFYLRVPISSGAVGAAPVHVLMLQPRMGPRACPAAAASSSSSNSSRTGGRASSWRWQYYSWDSSGFSNSTTGVTTGHVTNMVIHYVVILHLKQLNQQCQQAETIE